MAWTPIAKNAHKPRIVGTRTNLRDQQAAYVEVKESRKFLVFTIKCNELLRKPQPCWGDVCTESLLCWWANKERGLMGLHPCKGRELDFPNELTGRIAIHGEGKSDKIYRIELAGSVKADAEDGDWFTVSGPLPDSPNDFPAIVLTYKGRLEK